MHEGENHDGDSLPAGDERLKRANGTVDHTTEKSASLEVGSGAGAQLVREFY